MPLPTALQNKLEHGLLKQIEEYMAATKNNEDYHAIAVHIEKELEPFKGITLSFLLHKLKFTH